MIDVEKTLSLRGYDPLVLSEGSNKKVWAVCNVCGYGRWVFYQGYRNLCRRCAGINAIKELAKRNKGRPLSIEHRKKISKSMKGKKSEARKTESKRQCGGNDILQHHYIYDDSDRSKYTIGITRADHSKLHRLLEKLGYIVPHINIRITINGDDKQCQKCF